MDKVDSWYQAGGGDSDYYNKCSTYYPFAFNSIHGYVFSSLDSGICGMFVFQDVSVSSSDYIATKLNQTLIANKKYQLACKLRPSKNYRSADAIDFYFSKDSLYSLDSGFFHVTPQVSNPSGNIISDSLHWYVLVDTFTAAGDEQYLTIGSFRSGAVTNTLPGSSADPRAYMFIDSVSVVLLDTLSAINLSTDIAFSIYPNPANETIIVESNSPPGNLYVTDVMGKPLMQLNCTSNRSYFNIAHLPNGIYFIRKDSFCRKLIIQR
jgi:hypothetical protein